MKASYKHLLIGLAAGGAILLSTALYDRYVRSRPRKINPQRLEDDVKEFGAAKVGRHGLVDKLQVAFIVGLAKRYSPDYFQKERRRAANSRLVLLAKLNDKKYVDALVDAVNFEYKCLDDLCYEICQKLGISEEVFSRSKDYYFDHRDAEFTVAIQNIAARPKEPGNIKLTGSQARQVKAEMKELMREALDDSRLGMTAELKMKLRDGNLLEMHQKLLEIAVFDRIMQKHGVAQKDIEEAFNKYELDKQSSEQLI